jgi:hypothetical protein
MITLPLSNSSSQVELHLGIAAPHLAAAAAVRSGVTGGVVVDQPLQQRVVFLHGLQQQLLPHGCAATADMRSQQQSVVCCSNTSAMQPMAAHNTTAGDQSAGVQLSKAAAPAAVLQPHCPHSCSGGSSSSSSCANALQAAQRGVVMVRVGRSWGSGVLMTHSGLVLTNAHLFKDSSSSSSSSKVRQPRNEPQLHQRGNAGAGKSSDAAHSTEASTQGCSEQAEQQQQQQQQQLWREEAVNVRLAPDSSSSSSSWMPARLLYRFQGYLDIAVLQLQLSARQSSNSSSSSAFSQLQRHQQHMLHPLQLCGPAEDAAPGSNVFVIGHGLFGPGLPWPPAVTSGCAARVVQLANNGSSFDASRSGDSSSSSSELSLQPAAAAARLAHPRSSKPSMLITTAAVHGGASGGALVNAQGQLVGLVTSNARHARGATLPHCNFCIAAAELRPLWNWAQRVQQQQQQNQLGSNLSVRAVAYGASATTGTSGSSSSTPVGLAAAADAAASAAAMLRELQVLDLRDEAGSRLWALQQPLPTQRFSSNSSSGGAAAAAAAVERIGRKLQAKSSKDAELHSKL